MGICWFTYSNSLIILRQPFELPCLRFCIILWGIFHCLWFHRWAVRCFRITGLQSVFRKVRKVPEEHQRPVSAFRFPSRILLTVWYLRLHRLVFLTSFFVPGNIASVPEVCQYFPIKISPFLKFLTIFQF